MKCCRMVCRIGNEERNFVCIIEEGVGPCKIIRVVITADEDDVGSTETGIRQHSYEA